MSDKPDTLLGETAPQRIALCAVLRRLGLDLLVWLCAPALFLLAYVAHYGMPAEAVVPHLRAVLAVFVALSIVRMCFAATISRNGAAHAAMAVVTSTVVTALVVYYALVCIGLSAWGTVISWDLISTSAVHAEQLAQSLGISLAYVAAGFGAAYLALLGATWRYLARFDWTVPLSAIGSGRLSATLMLAAAVAFAVESFYYVVAPPAQVAEPFSLTFFALPNAWKGHEDAAQKRRVEALDLIEDHVRATYAPALPLAAPNNVVLIVVDALRPDHMGVYGYARDTTPNLSALAKQGRLRRVDGVRASCSSSICGIPSLVSGKYAHQLSNRMFMLHEVLKLHGYEVSAILGGNHTAYYGLDGLFAGVDTFFDGSRAPNDEVNDDRAVIDRAAKLPAFGGTPVMLQFHLMSAHLLGKRHPRFDRYVPAASYALSFRRASKPLESAVNFYDNGVLAADAAIGELLETLAARGYLRRALVVITADHGESLGEHGLYAHSNGVTEEELRIPLILISYGYQPQSIPAGVPAAQVDVAPTVLEELGVPRPRTWSGIPLQSAARRDYTYFQERHLAGLVDYRDPRNVWKYWLDSRSAREYALNLSRDGGAVVDAFAAIPVGLRRDWRAQVLQMLPEAVTLP